VQRIPPDEANSLFPDGDAPEHIERGVWRIPLPLPFALRSANAYLLGGDGEWALVDCGLGTPAGEAALRAGFEVAGVASERISAIVLTHAHPDHIGLAGPIHAASGAPVRLLGSEAQHLVQVWGDPEQSALRASQAMYAAHGMPVADLEQIARGNRAVRRAIHLPPTEALVPLADGDLIVLGGDTYQVIWTPGHSDYHLCLLRADGLFIAGDHVLPRITPNIGLYPNGRPNPLSDYRSGLARVRDLPVRLALPGHGAPFVNLAGRVDELLAHHAERAVHTRVLLAAYPDGADAYTLAGDLFGGRLRGPDDRRFALAETLAHLEDLRARGQVERIERGGRVVYAATAGVRADAIQGHSVIDCG
jgi:glyoxylase-like metal-dependent hydrolase (beta-lactamase superfamily II)